MLMSWFCLKKLLPQKSYLEMADCGAYFARYPHQNRGSSQFRVKLVSSYIFDWLILLIIAAGGFGFDYVTPNKRPFSLVDPTISYAIILLLSH
jgi:hypothetical protein